MLDPTTFDRFPASFRGLSAALVAASLVVVAASPATASGTAIRPLDGSPVTAVSPFDARQVDPDVAVLADGSFVVVFEEGFSSGGVILPEPPEHGRDGDVETIVARRFDAGGRPLGEAWVVNETTEGLQVEPELVADPAGGFAIAWIDKGLPRLRRYAADGQPTSGEVVITTDIALHGAEVRLAIDAAGRTLVVWESFVGTVQIRAMVVEADGTVGPLRTLGAGTAGHHARSPHAVALDDGGFFVVWTEIGDDAVFGQRLAADGSLVGPRADFGTVGPVVDAVTDTAGTGVVFAAAARDTDRPARWLALGPATGELLFEQALGEPPISGYSPRLASVAPTCLVASTDRGGSGHRLFTIGPTAGAPPGPDLAIDGAAFGPIEIAGHLASDDAPRLLAAWVRESDLAVVVRALRVDSPRLRLGAGGRFRVEVRWRDFVAAEGDGLAVPIAEDTGAFWFFDPANLELTVKVLDGRALNDHFWVFNGSLTNVEYTLTVTDTATGAVYTVTNPLGQFGSFGDVEALPGD